ncbi:MAG: S8 family serine peptidase [Burkholderiales bacterium]|nr:S8 family serine peptidase [Burkholderiales bacterium]
MTSHRPSRLIATSTLAALAALAAAASPAARAQDTKPPAAAPAKKVITNSDQLPRRTYTLDKLPSELLQAPTSELASLIAQLDKDVAADLAAYDIQDRATRTAMMSMRAAMAMLRGDHALAIELTEAVRAQQEKPADKLTSGVFTEIVARAELKGGSIAEKKTRVRADLESRWSAMPWAQVGDALKAGKSSLEIMSPNVVLGSFRTNLDPVAKNGNMTVPAGVVAGILSARVTLDRMLPYRDEAVAVMQGLIDKNQVVKQDKWTERLVTLAPTAKASPVVIGIWDSGVDMKLFPNAAKPGIAFDAQMNPVPNLLRDMGEAQARMPELKKYLRGSWDLRAAIDSPDARALKQKISSLKPEEVKQFQEDLSALSTWSHGTHVAGIAIDGNPFARVTAVAMHYSNQSVPDLPDEARSQRWAKSFTDAVASFKAAGARVVNMSWRYGPTAHEAMLGYHGWGKSAEERKARAKQLFEIEKAALEKAIAGAPDILFIAGSGNEDNSADFAQYIPAGLQLPNLITAGAVDVAGQETSFSTFGKTVVVHANGFEVLSYIPGGEKVKFSGTSMAAPQVANLAGKLFALKPDLKASEVKDLILKGAERDGRINLIHPKKTLALAGIEHEKLATTTAKPVN